MAIRSLNPATGELVKSFREEGSKAIETKLQLATDYFREWGRFAFSVRTRYMKRVAELLEENKEEYARLITEEMGKPITESRAEVEKCAWVCNYYAKQTKIFLQDDHIATEADQSFVAFEPLGVILAVMPWNFPFWQVFRFAAPALMAGNVVLLKHASNVPRCAQAIEEIFRNSGAPKGLFQTLLIGAGKVKKLIEDRRVAAVTLTGSDKAGSEVGEVAGKNIKKVVMELGGSDPFIVMREANLKQAVETAIRSRMLNTGQSCIAAKRFIVEKEVYRDFLKLLKKQIAALKPGDPMQEKTNIGPMAREDLLKELHSQVRYSVKKGAKLETGGKKIPGKGFFYQPTLLTHVTENMPVYSQEVFGPVASVIMVESEEEAIRVANDTEFGLGASIWTENIDQALRMAHQIEAGNVFINGMVRSDPRLPFGGIKRSGFGRELAGYGIMEFVNIKTIVVE